jgi:superfamily II DNA or RNA helicase
MGMSTWNVNQFIKNYETDFPFLLLPRGTEKEVFGWIRDEGLEIDLIDHTTIGTGMDIKLPKLSFSGKPRPYQAKAIKAVLKALNEPDMTGCVFRGPCGCGKTFLILALIHELQLPTLVIVHTNALARQWSENIARWYGFAPGRIGGGKKDDIKIITVAMQQTLWRRANEKPIWLDFFGLIAIDECHKVASRSFQVVSKMFPAKYRIGASADERRKDRLEILVTDTLGPLVHQIKKKDLIGYGNLVPTKLEVIKTNYYDQIFLDSLLDKNEVGNDWVGMISRLTQDEDRNDVILQKIIQILETEKDARILCLSERVEACYYLAGQINEQINLVAGIMVGGPENRAELEKTMAGLQTGKVRVGFGTSVADEGLDIPALTHVFMTCPVHGHPKRMVQMIGRAARPWKKKKHAVAVYFWDQNIFPVLNEETTLEETEYQHGKFLRRLERSTEVCSMKVT